ncbi:methyl-accepting chemotaxis protein [Thiomicrorhabdus aquaedulcis]|uniref:methyl-accepting chemotaxis protein n=1 Tax=Thiomicrorhabdus aquaedulcis TaxID=2211106 RepID=UPI000FDC3E57|nr:methyl-accepting chemotaxis protein [Thiomicrorhabdus aquaedulcis]
MQFHSLKAKVMAISVVVATVVSIAVGSVLYITQVSPVNAKAQDTLKVQMAQFIDGKIDLKIQSGIIGATMISLQFETQQALLDQYYDPLKASFKTLKADYEAKTNFKGIFSEIITPQGQSVLRSWDLQGEPKDVSQDSLVKTVLESKQAKGSLGFGQRGVVITSISPVLVEKNIIGLATMVQGVGSISRDFSQEHSGAWVMLIDTEYAKKSGYSKAIETLDSVTPRYVLANNKWFSPEVIALAKQVYRPVDGQNSAVYLQGDSVVVDLPAYDQEGQVFGRQVFIQDKTVFTQYVTQAKNQAWLTLLSVVGAIILLATVLLLSVIRLVVKPLESLKKTMFLIEDTGDFSMRSTIKTRDEVGQTAQAINHHLDRVSSAINEANGAVAALASGNLQQRIQGRYVGDLRLLQDGINQSAENVSGMISEIGKAIDKLKQGEFNIEINQDAKGVFASILQDTSVAMQSLNSTLSQTNNVMQQVSNGVFQHRVQTAAQGELAMLKKAINQTLNNLDEVIQDISKVMLAQSQGDLTQRVEVECLGDLLALKTAINQNAEHLNRTIYGVMVSANTVAGAADEVALGSQSLSDSVQQQAASMEQTSATMEEMNAAIKNNAENAVTVDHLEHELENNSKIAGKVMHDTIEAMNEIQASSHKIGEIVTLIDSIAFQTNLLALNAAVEAARAGEHGRGFAVVASEVRNLAQKSADAAKDINLLIGNSIALINRGTHLAGESEQVLSKMNVSISEVTGMIANIANTSSEQARGVGEVNQALSLMDDVTQQNAALVEETSAAAESLKEQANVLTQRMSEFKIVRP